MSERLRVLLVEDEASVRAVIAAFLKTEHDVQTAENGVLGLERFRAGSWDVVLCDGSLGDMSGVELAAAMKEISPATPIILISGADFSQPALSVGETPFTSQLQKPFGPNGLKAAITAALAR